MISSNMDKNIASERTLIEWLSQIELNPAIPKVAKKVCSWTNQNIVAMGVSHGERQWKRNADMRGGPPGPKLGVLHNALTD